MDDTTKKKGEDPYEDFVSETERLRAAARLPFGQETVTESLAEMVHVVSSPGQWQDYEANFVAATDGYGFLSFDLEKNNGKDETPRVAIVTSPSCQVYVFPLQEYAAAASRPVMPLATLLPRTVVERIQSEKIITANVGIGSDCGMSDLKIGRPFELTETIKGLKELWQYDFASSRAGIAFASVQEVGFHCKPFAWFASELKKAISKKAVKFWHEFGFEWKYDGIPNHRLGSKLYHWPAGFYNDKFKLLYVCLDGLVPVLVVRRAIGAASDECKGLPAEQWALESLRNISGLKCPLQEMMDSDSLADAEVPVPDWVMTNPLRTGTDADAEEEDSPDLLPIEAQLQFAKRGYEQRRLRELQKLEVTFPSLSGLLKKTAEDYGEKTEAVVPRKKISPSLEKLRELQQLQVPQLATSDTRWVGKDESAVPEEDPPRPSRSQRPDRKTGIKHLRMADRLVIENSHEPKAHLVRCGFCGSSSHGQYADGRVNCEWQRQAARERAEKGEETMRCDYPICTLRTAHDTSVCRTLHSLCEQCWRRGHRSEVCPGREDYEAAECLRTLFETFADRGALTRLRRASDASAGSIEAAIKKNGYVWIDCGLGFLRVPINCPRNLLCYSTLRQLSVEGGEDLIASQLDEEPHYHAMRWRGVKRKTDPSWSFGDLSWRGRDPESLKKIDELRQKIAVEKEKKAPKRGGTVTESVVKRVKSSPPP